MARWRDTALLFGSALVFNNLTGLLRYPPRKEPPPALVQLRASTTEKN